MILSSDKRKVRYLGEIENKGQQPYCFIDITFSTLNASGKPIDQGQARVELNGVTLTVFNNEVHTCLRPGQFGSFDTLDTGEINLTEDFADFDFRMCFKNNIERCQAFAQAQEPRIPLALVDFQLNEDTSGMRIFSGRLRNDSTDQGAIAYDTKIHFTMLNAQGKVISTAGSEILRAQVCSGNIQAENLESCLGLGILTDPFGVNTNIPTSEICDGCFYSRIHHSE